MPSSTDLGVRTITGWRAAWRCRYHGFAAVAPVSGSTTVAAVGSVSPVTGADPDVLRVTMRSVLDDLALVVGHDPAALLDRVNATLSALGAGRLDAAALLSRPDDAIPASVAGCGDPAPLVVGPGHLAALLRGRVVLDQGWGVVLGAADAPGRAETLLTPSEVGAALALLDPPPAAGAPTPRTLLAILAV